MCHVLLQIVRYVDNGELIAKVIAYERQDSSFCWVATAMEFWLKCVRPHSSSVGKAPHGFVSVWKEVTGLGVGSFEAIFVYLLQE